MFARLDGAEEEADIVDDSQISLSDELLAVAEHTDESKETEPTDNIKENTEAEATKEESFEISYEDEPSAEDDIIADEI